MRYLKKYHWNETKGLNSKDDDDDDDGETNSFVLRKLIKSTTKYPLLTLVRNDYALKYAIGTLTTQRRLFFGWLELKE